LYSCARPSSSSAPCPSQQPTYFSAAAAQREYAQRRAPLRHGRSNLAAAMEASRVCCFGEQTQTHAAASRRRTNRRQSKRQRWPARRVNRTCAKTMRSRRMLSIPSRSRLLDASVWLCLASAFSSRWSRILICFFTCHDIRICVFRTSAQDNPQKPRLLPLSTLVDMKADLQHVRRKSRERPSKHTEAHGCASVGCVPCQRQCCRHARALHQPIHTKVASVVLRSYLADKI
jgi:hypothetical protein